MKMKRNLLTISRWAVDLGGFLLLATAQAAQVTAGNMPQPQAAPAAGPGTALRHFDEQAIDIPRGLPEMFTANVRLDGVPAVVQVVRHSLRSSDFKLLEDRGDGQLVQVDPPPVRTYKGVV